MYQISDRFPLPGGGAPNVRGRPRSKRLETVSALGPRQSFFLEATIQSMSPTLAIAKAKHPEREFLARTVVEEGKKGVRIWRAK